MMKCKCAECGITKTKFFRGGLSYMGKKVVGLSDKLEKSGILKALISSIWYHVIYRFSQG